MPECEQKRASMRLERDSMGDKQVPEDALWGASTQRAVENFSISSLRLSQNFISTLGMVKIAAAHANMSLGLLDAERGRIWRGTASELQAILTGPSAPNRRQAEELLYWPKATGTYLGRLADRSDLYATEYQLLVRKGPHQKGVQTYAITETDAPADWRLPL